MRQAAMAAQSFRAASPRYQGSGPAPGLACCYTTVSSSEQRLTATRKSQNVITRLVIGADHLLVILSSPLFPSPRPGRAPLASACAPPRQHLFPTQGHTATDLSCSSTATRSPSATRHLHAQCFHRNISLQVHPKSSVTAPRSCSPKTFFCDTSNIILHGSCSRSLFRRA